MGRLNKTFIRKVQGRDQKLEEERKDKGTLDVQGIISLSPIQSISKKINVHCLWVELDRVRCFSL